MIEQQYKWFKWSGLLGLGLLLLVGIAPSAYGQKKEKDKIEYFTDSQIKRSRFSIALNAQPAFINRRIINNEFNGGGGVDLGDDDAQGAFKFNYGVDFFYKLSSSFAIGLGYGFMQAEYDIDELLFSFERPDTLRASQNVNITTHNIPLKINFSTQLTDIFWLEIVPNLELNFMTRYESEFRPKDGSLPSFSENFDGRTNEVNASAGIGLGGKFYVSERWDFFIRADLKYMLNELLLIEGFPRESLVGYGSTLGFRYNF